MMKRLLAIATLLVSKSIFAGEVALVATIEGEPAFESIEWNVPDTNNKHSVIVKVPAQKHVICASRNGMKYSVCKKLEVKEGDSIHLVNIDFEDKD